jgi:hypothetical protein
MCMQHRSEYMKEKMRLYALRKKERISLYGGNTCKIKPHDYFTLNEEKEQCKNCGIAIRHRKLWKEPYRLGVAEGINSTKYLGTLHCYHTAAPKRFPPVSTDAHVANILYHLRYDRGWDADRIVKVAHMSHSVLNRYIIRFPWRRINWQ